MIERVVGDTPLVKLGPSLYAKLETYNPSGSIKDRMALYIIKEAEGRGELEPGDTIVEATSGNTGISMAMIGASRGYEVIIIMPRNMSEERKQMIRAYGAKIIEVGDNAFLDAIELKEKMCAEGGKGFYNPRQFSNPDNIACHVKTTAREILDQLPAYRRPSAIVLGSGTGGTIMGLHKRLVRRFSDLRVVQVCPEEDNLSHGIQGINDGKDFLLDPKIVNEVIKVSTKDAIERAKRLAREDGLLVGISSGANVLASERWAAKRSLNGNIVLTVLCDRGERYLSCY